MRTHLLENNPGSQMNLDFNRDRFSKKCQEVFDLLMKGKELTVLEAANMGISSLPRRCLDLKQNGVRLSDRWANGVKVYYMSELDKELNSNL